MDSKKQTEKHLSAIIYFIYIFNPLHSNYYTKKTKNLYISYVYIQL